jgi:hypothetical protein
MKFKPGEDVIVNFAGHETPGEVIAVQKNSGFVLCRIHIDPELDYGEIGARLDPEPTVCVRESNIHHA